MEVIKLASILSAFLWIGLFVAAFFALLLWGWLYGKENLKNEKEYEALYKEIQDDINNNDLPATFENYDLINKKFTKLRWMKWVNKEKTDQLRINFRIKFQKQWLTRATEGYLKRGIRQTI